MRVAKNEPLNSAPTLMSTEKRAWWVAFWPKRDLKQPRAAVFHFAMNSTRRPTAPAESVAFGYMTLNKFHDREPEAVLKVIEKLDPAFFDDFPRKEGTKLTAAFKKAVIGEAARAFYRHGLAAYGKPKLRRTGEVPPAEEPLATL